MSKYNYFAYKEKGLDKFSTEYQQDLVFDLINAFSLANNPLDSALLLQDLLTEDEIRDLSKRLRIARLVLKGETHEEIVSELHCSYATITKVRIWLNNAGDGLKKVISRLPERKRVSIPKRTPGAGYGLPTILSYYLSAGLKKSEQKKLGNFLQNMKGKSSGDRDLKEATDLEFRNKSK
ncbi:MAG: Uncharacterized protein CEO21_299 [Microgenomates group bacterium Gr01-1014_80]|nr:MAG: Uncharacterized protein CEO21_299 [Microgenomates group bacterium Gr01-1014_80]